WRRTNRRRRVMEREAAVGSLLLLVQLNPPVRPAYCGSFHPVAVDGEIRHVVTSVCQAVAFKSPYELELGLPPHRMNLAPTKHSVPIDLFDRNVVGAVHLRRRLLGPSSIPLSYQRLGIDVLSHNPGQRHKNRGEAYSKPGQDETSLHTAGDIHRGLRM